jgi:hypothetical protein
MSNGRYKVDACYDTARALLAAHDDEYRNTHGHWMSNDELFEGCKRTVKGLTRIQFDAAMEIENDTFSPEVERYLKRIQYI